MFKRHKATFKSKILAHLPSNSLGNLIETADAVTADLSVNVNKRKEGCLLVCSFAFLREKFELQERKLSQRKNQEK